MPACGCAEVLSPRRRDSSRSEARRSVLSGSPHGQSRAAANNTGGQRDKTKTARVRHAAPERAKRACKVVFAQSRAEALVRGGHRKKPVLAGFKVFIFSLSFLSFPFTVFCNEELFGDVQVSTHSEKALRVILSL